MRVLRVIPTLDPSSGGPAATLCPITEALTRLFGHTVEIACLDSADAPWLKGFSLPVHCLGPRRNRYGYSTKLAEFLRLNLDNYGCVIVHGIWGFIGYAVWRASRRTRTPYVVHPHGMLLPGYTERYTISYLKKIIYWLAVEYRVLRDAKAVLFVCEQERLLAGQTFRPYRCCEQVVCYGTAPPSGSAELQLRSFFGRFPELEGKQLILFLGRIHFTKGCDLLIEAFSRIAREVDRAHLLIAGPDEVGWKASLLKKASKFEVEGRITWAGLLTGDIKWGALRAADVFVLPSHQDNTSVAMMEALACGVPVLISNKVHIWPEIIADGAGFMEADTVEGTYKLMAGWFKLSEKERAQVRLRALRCFKERFEASIAASSLNEVLTRTGSR
jgi:glycosyltransferase involved in cell wall biosynthesis